MSLTFKLAACLAAVLAATLASFVEMGNRAFHREASSRRDAELARAWETAARRLGEGAGGASERLAILRATAEAAGLGALEEALLLDERGRVSARAGVSPEGVDALGELTSRPHLLLAQQQPGPFVQRLGGPDARRVYSFPLADKGRRRGTLAATYREPALEEAHAWIRDAARGRLALAAIVGLAVALLASVALSAQVLRPLERLAEAVRRAGAGDLGERVPETSADELGALSREFNRMAARLGEVDRLKDEFVAQVTHDLRSPLHGMLGQADVLLRGYDGPLNAKQEEGLRTLLKSGAELARLIDDILDVARLEAGGAPLERVDVDVESALADAVGAVRAEAERLGLEVAVHRQPELAFVRADASALRRVLGNLLSNALRFTPAGGQVTLSARRDGARSALFGVSDNGVGIPEHRLEGLFRKFSQVPETRDRVRGHPGSGLGLAICRELVEAHGGRIWAESKPGEGARFCFTLPLGDHSK